MGRYQNQFVTERQSCQLGPVCDCLETVMTFNVSGSDDHSLKYSN